ncbi:MAG: zinc ribbon domain-containing protein, partial [Promethearchaeota archaeon]
VVHIWDQYHWAQGSNHQLILNAIDWISIPNSYSPQLVNASVSPKIGYQNTEFNFRVAYLDLDNNAPRDINAIINGTAYPMSKIDPLDNNYIDGCIYEISTFLIPLTTTNYSYYFECSDGKYSNSTFIYNDIEVFETNYAPPKLLNPQVSPLIGGNNTIFTFLIDYYDDDNNQPHNINISIDGMEFLMEKVDISDNNAMDGIQYYYQTTLDYGFYNFMMQCYDGFYSNSTEWIDAPEVNPFYDIGGGIIFKDDFEDGSFDTDWTVTGFGLGGVDMATSNSGVYSAYHSSDIGSITLKTIDLSSYRNVNLSYWIRRGSDEFSEEPDLGEDFYVEYYSNTGTWEQIAIYPGDGIPGEIFHQISFILPTNALHSEFSLRFRQETGSGAGFDYWHFDDVMLTADQSLVLLSPINGAILFNGMNTFQWRGFNDIIPNVNYTIQLSNSSDFSLLNYEIVDIQGTDIMTNVSIDLQLSNGQYFWRVRPTYEIFSGNWTNFNAFTFMQNDYIPNLTNFSVFPYIGTHRTIFNFSVLYQDKDDNPPFSISVVINGIINQMQKIEINDDNYTDGCWYQLITTLQPNTFNYTYYFECTDGKFLDNSTSFNDIFVYNNAPLLIGGTVDPKIGYGSNTYTFKVLYLDIDNDFPEYVFVIINGVYGNMSKIDFSDNNYIDGCLYQYQTRLYANSVNYTYSFICSDGFNYTSTAVNNDLKVEENPTDPIVEGLPFIIGGSVIGLIGLGLTIGLIKVKKSQKHYQMGSLEKERLTDSLKSSNNTYDEYFRKKQIVSGQRACSNCGKISPLESRYCVYCGKIIESQSNIRASADSMKNGGAMGFPGHYGCPHCNKMIPNNSIFCIYCGKPVR